jgi:hypothetical protein
MSITNLLFYNYLKANLKNDTTIESIESVIEKSTYIYKPPNYEGSFTK